MTLTKILFAAALTFGAGTAAQAVEPCGPSRAGVAGGLVGGLEAVASDLATRQDGLCREIENRIYSTRRRIAIAEAEKDAADVEQRYWSGQARAFIKGQTAVITENFGENILVTTAAISTELVLDAYGAGKALSGARYVHRASTMAGAVRAAMMGAARQRFQQALAAEALSKGQAVLTGISNPSWSWWELIPFVSPLKRLNRMAGTDDAVEALGDAQRYASNQAAKARRRRMQAEDQLEELREKMGDLREELGRCQSGSGS